MFDPTEITIPQATDFDHFPPEKIDRIQMRFFFSYLKHVLIPHNLRCFTTIGMQKP